MKLYATTTCPYVQRVLLGLQVRRVSRAEMPIEMVDLAHPPEPMLAINPNGSVPTLELAPKDGFNESLVILEFLDSLNAPGPKLFGSTAAETAKTKVALENLSSRFLQALMTVNYARGNELQLRKGIRALPTAFQALDAALAKQKGPFFGGDVFNAVDCALAPFIVRASLARELRPEIPSAPEGSRASAYISTLTTHPFIKDTTPSDLVQAMKTFVLPEAGVQQVKDASRTLLAPETLESRVQALNAQIPKATKGLVSLNSPVWSIGHDSKGPFLHARFGFNAASDALDAIQTLAIVQETADHHTACRFENFSTLELTLCTHEPKWGITEKDFALASVLTRKLVTE